MLFKEIKTWGNKLGYKVVKENKDPVEYSWTKLDSSDPNDSGVARSVSKLATQIYNHMTDSIWVEHQKKYKENLQLKKVNTSDY